MDYLVYLESFRSQLEDRICERGYVYREVRLRPSLARISESVCLIHPRVIPLRGWEELKKFGPVRPSGSRDIAAEKSRRTFRCRCQKEGS